MGLKGVELEYINESHTEYRIIFKFENHSDSMCFYSGQSMKTTVATMMEFCRVILSCYMEEK